MTSANSSLAEALIDIIKPIVEEAVRRILCISSHEAQPEAYRAEAFLTVKQASDISSLAPSTIRLYIRKRRISARKVGRRVLIKRADLEAFLESNPIPVIPNKFLT